MVISKGRPVRCYWPGTYASSDTVCENLFDGVSQTVRRCAQCGKMFEGTGDYCSSECEQDEYDDRWDD